MSTHSQKPLLIILPGWGGSEDTWAVFTELAREYFDAYCIELPCFGKKKCPKTVWGVGEYAAYVDKEIKKIQTEHKSNTIIVLGHSFGGQVAGFLARFYSESCHELVLVAPAIIRPKRIIKRAIFSILTPVAKKIFTSTNAKQTGKIRQKLYTMIQSPDYTQTSGVQRDIFQRIIREDMREVVSDLTQKTLIFWGTKDSHTPPRHAKRIAKIIPHNKLTMYVGGRHGLHHTHTPDIIGEMKKTYIDNTR